MIRPNLTAAMRCACCFMWAGLLVLPGLAGGETLVQTTVESRVLLAVHGNPAAVSKLLPAPWRLNPIAKGPMQGTNMFVVFGDRAIDLNPDGTPRSGGIARFTAFAAPATNPDTGMSGFMVFRIFTANEQSLPGPYKASVFAAVNRQYSYSGTDMEIGVAEEKWLTEAHHRADIRLSIRYRKALPSRSDREFKVFSAIEPDFYRIYRVDQGTDIVMSRPGNINRLLSLEVTIDVPEFANVFDGSEELISVAVLPWYVRSVFLP